MPTLLAQPSEGQADSIRPGCQSSRLRLPPAAVLLAFVALSFCASTGSARADKIAHSAALFAGLDKITGRIISFEVAINETVQFGTLQITPRVCYSRPPTEAPRTDGFVEIYEINHNKKSKKKYTKIFSGWMFAGSPGLNGVEHPIYDVWLTACKGKTKLVPSRPDVADETNRIRPAEVPTKPGTTNVPSAARQAQGKANGGSAAPPLGPPVYVPSRPDPAAVTPPAPARPAAARLPPGPRPPAAIPAPEWPRRSQRFSPLRSDVDNPYQRDPYR